jgi:hypothetical protein
MRRAKTSFEQVPLRTVLKLLARGKIHAGKTHDIPENLTIERPAGKIEPYSVRKL